MLKSVEGSYENGAVRLLESIPGIARARDVVTILPDTLSPLPQREAPPVAATPPESLAAAEDPLSWSLTEAEKQVWDELPEFRKQHPVAFDAMGTDE